MDWGAVTILAALVLLGGAQAWLVHRMRGNHAGQQQEFGSSLTPLIDLLKTQLTAPKETAAVDHEAREAVASLQRQFARLEEDCLRYLNSAGAQKQAAQRALRKVEEAQIEGDEEEQGRSGNFDFDAASPPPPKQTDDDRLRAARRAMRGGR